MDWNPQIDMGGITFSGLVESIRSIHEMIVKGTKKAVNTGLTLRNWVIGYYIIEYEQNGSDRAKYGENLLGHLSEHLSRRGIRRMEERELRRFRKLYRTYPQIRESLTPEFLKSVPSITRDRIGIRDPTTPEMPALNGSTLISRLSFTHLAELISIDDDLKRAFYEVECIRGNWSVRELKRQVESLLYERSGLSRNKKRLSELVQRGVEMDAPELAIRDPYVFEFLGLRAEEVLPESKLENDLIMRLQDFLLELGTGFCFEARQKRILIGDTYGFIDLVFYHRILKCHVLIELKRSGFNHEDIGQLNTYVSWYRENIASGDDNPPVGILLCTKKDSTLVEYALAGMNNQLFVSKYQLELPNKEDIRKFIEEQIHNDLLEPDGSFSLQLNTQISDLDEDNEVGS